MEASHFHTSTLPNFHTASMLERLFRLRENRTTARTEIVAGVTTFMTMAYIVALNPLILSGSPDHPGPPITATVTATCIGAAIPTLLMGFVANYPVALASGMGLNAAVIAAVRTMPGVTWQTMMGAIFLEGLIITVLVLTRFRSAVMDAIPMDIKRAIGVGIGLFIALLGLHEAHWMSGPPGSPSVLPPIGNFHMREALVATAGIVLTAFLLVRRMKGALLIGIAATTLIAVVAKIAALPSSVFGSPDASTIGKMNLLGALQPALVGLIFSFLISDFFDTMGTVIAVGEQGGFLDKDGRLPRLNRVLLIDSLAAMWGGFCSASSVTTYIESASGIGEGGRTGLTSVTVGLLFLVSMFFAPLVAAVPHEATAAALILVGFMMMSMIRDIDFKELGTAIPAFLILLVIPLTMSIARGIGIGFIVYVLLKILSGRFREAPITLYILAALFAITFYFERTG